MDTQDENKKEETVDTTLDENVSLDDMMAAAVENSEDPKGEEEGVVAVVDADEAAAIANESETAPETPTEETTPTDEPTTVSETGTEPEETTTDLVEEGNKEEAEEAVQEESETASEEEVPVAPATPLPPRKEYKGKWYIVHTYSGHENKVAKTLMQRVQAMGFEERIFDALVPTRDTIRVRGGKKETIKEKIFPGYILVNMDLSDEAWVLVRTTPGVTSFVGAQNKPTPIRDDEVQAIVAFVGQKDPVYKAQFSMGEAVKITDGPFSDFLGTVESIDEGKGKIKVLVSIFGRETPVELDFLQVAKI